MTRLPPEPFAAFIGIDWADAKHDVCRQAADAETREFRALAHTPEALEEWVHTLRARFQGQPLALCLDLNKGPIIAALRRYDCLALFPGTPLTRARYRDAVAPSRAQDDPPDAALQLARRLTPRDTLTPFKSQGPARRALEQLVEHRRRPVGAPVRITNRLTSALKNSSPHVLQWVHEKETAIFCDFLTQGPPLKAVPPARRATLERFFRDHHGRYAEAIGARIQAIKRATPLPPAEGVITPQALLVQALVTPLRVTLPAIEASDNASAQHAPRPPDCPLFSALPGAGAVFAPRLRVACGEHRDRDAAAEELQKDAGIAPVTERSGNKTWVHGRLQCPTFPRQPSVEWAAESTRHASWARPYYQHPRDQGTSHPAAVRALAFKWMRLLVRCWQHRTPYDEAIDLNARQRRGAPRLPNNLADVA